jgi:branched-subunit amino acid transport protein
MTSPTDPHRAAADDPAASRSAATLVSDVLQQSANLVRQEMQLAKTEVSEGLTRLKTALGEIIAGVVLVMVSLAILLAALVSGVARLLVGIFGADTEVEPVVVEGLDEQGAAIVAALERSIDTSLGAARTLPTYEGVAALIVGVIFAVIGALLLKRGLDALDAGTVMPERAVEQAKKDGRMMRDKT